MLLIVNAGTLLVRRNTHMRSLFLEFPEVDIQCNILADLFSLKNESLNIALSVTIDSKKGIELSFPAWLSGMFYVKIQSGAESILRKIAIQ
ncbi:MAG: hypothetical protein M3R25_00835 [Bacteroidota bacterium]|nr:hypothetical protein [Bacteroidota bacterium]